MFSKNRDEGYDKFVINSQKSTVLVPAKKTTKQNPGLHKSFLIAAAKNEVALEETSAFAQKIIRTTNQMDSLQRQIVIAELESIIPSLAATLKENGRKLKSADLSDIQSEIQTLNTTFYSQNTSPGNALNIQALTHTQISKSISTVFLVPSPNENANADESVDSATKSAKLIIIELPKNLSDTIVRSTINGKLLKDDTLVKR